MTATTLSLVIATFNGEKTLPLLLESINRLDVVDDTYVNIVIVNNNSSDNTANILDQFECKFEFHQLFEAIPGKNTALNTAIDSDIHLGDLIIFSDDDVIYPEHFFKTYVQLYKTHPEFDIFGGKVIAKWPSSPDPNMLAGIDPVVAFAITPESAGYTLGEIDPIKLHGPNMAITRKVFDKGTRYNESIGPNGGEYVMGSETDILYRLKASNLKAYFCPELAVQHIIRPVQFTPKWLASRAYKAGRSLVNHHKSQGHPPQVTLLMGYPRWAVVQYLKLTLQSLFVAYSKNKKYYALLWKRSHLKGYLFEFKKQNKLTSQDSL